VAATGAVPVVVIIAAPAPQIGTAIRCWDPAQFLRAARVALAEHGIASLRYDKRGMPGTKGTFDMT